MIMTAAASRDSWGAALDDAGPASPESAGGGGWLGFLRGELAPLPAGEHAYVQDAEQRGQQGSR
jgi:hypothetical protein